MRIFLLPGLAANENLFKYLTKAFDNIVIPQWIAPLGQETLADYSKRLAHSLDLTPEDYVGGMSFGGQVALEIAKVKDVKGLLLISSQRTSEETSPTFKFQQKMTESLSAEKIRSSLKAVGLPLIKLKENLKPQEFEWLAQMLDTMDIEFFKWASCAIVEWDYRYSREDLKCPIFQIHGKNDFIIKIKDWPETHFLPDANHLINYTHHQEVITWLKKCTSIPG